MKKRFHAVIRREGEWFVAQCLDVDVASQGETEPEALAALREALELHFQPPLPTKKPKVVLVTLGAADAG